MERPFLPLRLKITLGSLAVFTAIHVLVSATWIALQQPIASRAVEARLDRELEVKARECEAMLVQPEASFSSKEQVDALVTKISRAPLFERFAVYIWADDGTLYSSSSADELLSLARIDRPGDQKINEFRTTEVDLADGTRAELRMISFPFRNESGRPFRLLLATPIPPTPDLFHELLRIGLYSLPIGWLAAGFAAWIMAGRVVWPIEKFTEAARSIGPTSLEGRIDVSPANAEIARLQRELNDAFERLEKGYRAQGMFISNVSHELKTPIAVLLSQAQVLKQENRSPIEYRRFLAVVEEEMRILGRLVESFLVLARVDRGKEHLRVERTPVNDVVVDVAEHCTALSRHHEVPLVTILHLAAEGENEAEVEGDPELLRTMLENLVRNALRFSPKGEPVDLRVTCTKDRVSITVRDRGPGIPREHVERIFDRFFQIAEQQQGQRGTGLGLAIAKSVAELHHGTISVRNCVDRGCEFEVLLPLAKDASVEPAARAEIEARVAEHEPARARPARPNEPDLPASLGGLQPIE